VVVDDFNVMRITRLKAKYQTPRTVDGHSPLSRSIAAQLVEPDAAQMAQIVECLRGIQLAQPQSSPVLIQA
jgi:hypothetical protein